MERTCKWCEHVIKNGDGRNQYCSKKCAKKARAEQERLRMKALRKTEADLLQEHYIDDIKRWDISQECADYIRNNYKLKRK